MHCPIEAAACAEQLEKIRLSDPARYSQIMFLAGPAAADMFAPAPVREEQTA